MQDKLLGVPTQTWLYVGGGLAALGLVALIISEAGTAANEAEGAIQNTGNTINAIGNTSLKIGGTIVAIGLLFLL